MNTPVSSVVPNKIRMPGFGTSGSTIGCLYSGNFEIGCSDQVIYAPTSTTGFWQGWESKEFKYVVYETKASQGPSIHTPNNEDELRIYTGYVFGLGPTHFDITAEAIQYYHNNNNLLCVNIDYPNIITKNLVALYDMGYTPSCSQGIAVAYYDGNSNYHQPIDHIYDLSEQKYTNPILGTKSFSTFILSGTNREQSYLACSGSTYFTCDNLTYQYGLINDDAFSLCFWLKRHPQRNNQGVLAKLRSTSGVVYQLKDTSSDVMPSARLQIQGGDNEYDLNLSGTYYSDYYFVGISCDVNASQKVMLYLNADEVSDNKGYNNGPYEFDNFIIGYDGNSNYFNGDGNTTRPAGIAFFAAYNTGLTFVQMRRNQLNSSWKYGINV